MSRRLQVFTLATLAVAGFASPARSGELTDAEAKRLFNERRCNACHAVDEMRIGPPFRAVALRYQDGAPESIERLATKIIVGGAGAWGNVPMVANPAISPEEARAIVRWILPLARAKPAG